MGFGRRGRSAPLLLIVAALALSRTPAAGQETESRGPLHPCTLERPAVCGTVDVAEDPDLPEGRHITLNVVVLPAEAEAAERRPDPVFILDAGPGQAATRSMDWVVRELAAVRATRDIVLVDRRGTGASNPLDCPGETGRGPDEMMAPLSDAWIASCRRALEQRADLTRYTSPFAADDLDAVRRGGWIPSRPRPGRRSSRAGCPMPGGSWCAKAITTSSWTPAPRWPWPASTTRPTPSTSTPAASPGSRDPSS